MPGCGLGRPRLLHAGLARQIKSYREVATSPQGGSRRGGVRFAVMHNVPVISWCGRVSYPRWGRTHDAATESQRSGHSASRAYRKGFMSTCLNNQSNHQTITVRSVSVRRGVAEGGAMVKCAGNKDRVWTGLGRWLFPKVLHCELIRSFEFPGTCSASRRRIRSRECEGDTMRWATKQRNSYQFHNGLNRVFPSKYRGLVARPEV